MRALADKIVAWIDEPLDTDVTRALQRLGRLPDVRHVAVMPDVHLSEQVCVGVALATRELIYPAAIGQDIGCGVRALRLSLDRQDLGEDVCWAVLDGMSAALPIQRHPRRQTSAELDTTRLSSAKLRRFADHDASLLLGTLGRGNHFVELDYDDDARAWLVVHSGSRGLGPALAEHYAAEAGGGLRALSADSEPGRALLGDVAFALDWAAENRRRLALAAIDVLCNVVGEDVRALEVIDTTHDFVRLESHGSEMLYVHRKGALSAADGEASIIPGSMGSGSCLVSGRGHAPALCSSSHGAGRLFSRGQARRRVAPEKLLREMRGVVFDQRLLGVLCEEAPSAYKKLERVMHAQHELTRTIRRLKPLMVYKGA